MLHRYMNERLNVFLTISDDTDFGPSYLQLYSNTLRVARAPRKVSSDHHRVLRLFEHVSTSPRIIWAITDLTHGSCPLENVPSLSFLHLFNGLHSSRRHSYLQKAFPTARSRFFILFQIGRLDDYLSSSRINNDGRPVLPFGSLLAISRCCLRFLEKVSTDSSCHVPWLVVFVHGIFSTKTTGSLLSQRSPLKDSALPYLLVAVKALL